MQDAQEQLFRLRFQMGMGQTEGLKKVSRAEEGSRANVDDAEGKRCDGGGAGRAPAKAPAARKAAKKQGPEALGRRSKD